VAQSLLSDAEDLPELLDEAAGVIASPAMAQVFAPDTLAEVPVTAPLGDDRLHGVIDRLIVTPDHVLAVDFKSNATVPATPEACPGGLLRQMGAYAAALAQIYPDRTIGTAIIWTRTATLMPLPHELVSAALSQRDAG
jgi:ATP-dependent helicase/nuclease subunit A